MTPEAGLWNVANVLTIVRILLVPVFVGFLLAGGTTWRLVALATFDDAYFAELLDPPLTAVAYDPSEVGRRAAALLVEAIGDGETPPESVRIPVTLVTRRSCGCGEPE